MRVFLLVLVLLSGHLAAQEIPIIGPATPTLPGAYVVLQIAGLPDTDLPHAAVESSPAVGVTLIPAKSWAGSPMVLFSAASPGKYQVSLTLHAWRQHADTGLAEAKRTGVSGPLIAEYEALAKKLAEAYKIRRGTCVVEVAGTVPPPKPPEPPIPPPTPSGKRIVVILHESQETTPQQATTFSQLRSGTAATYLTSKQHELLILDRDHPQALAWMPKLGAETIPAVVISDPVSSAVYYVGKLPNTASEVIETVKKFGG